MWQPTPPRRSPLPLGDLPWLAIGSALLVSLGHATFGRRGALLAATIGVVCSLLLLWHRRRPLRAGRLVLNDGTLRRLETGAAEDESGELLVSRGELLGISLLADTAPGTALLVLTTPSRVRVLAVAVRTREELADLAALLPPVRSEARHRPSSALLRARDAVRLSGELLREFPHAAERLFMRGARGESISLDRTELNIGPSRVRLEEPFDYRAFAFFESTGHVVSAYQGAWIRQVHDGSLPWHDDVGPAPHECVFVAALSGEGERPWPILDPAETAQLLRAPRHAVDSLLFPTLHRKITSTPGALRAPESRRPVAPAGQADGRSSRW